MAVDYSKLSEEELKAIANNDYSKLSDATLEAIANKPKSQQQKPVEGSGGAAFGVYRPQGRRTESQNQNREANKDMAIQTIRGAASAPFTAAAGLPVDIGNVVYGQAIKPAIDFAASQAKQLRMPQYSDLPPAVQSAGNLMGGAYNTIVRGQEFQPLPQVPKAEKIPGIGDYGMNFYNQFVPGPVPANAAQQMAFAGSQALTGGLANRVAGGAIAAPRVIRGGANQVRTGAMEGVTNPVQKPGPNTAFAELGDQVYPNTTVKPWQTLSNEQKVQGLPALEASQQPSGSLFSGFLDKAALRLAPEGPTGGKLVPLEGKGLQAFTEQTTRDFFNKPKSFNDVLSGKYGNIGGALAGLAVTAGNPLGAAAGFFAPQYVKALEILAQRRLQNKAALQPNFQQQLGQAQQTAGRIGLESSLPQTPLLGYTPRSGGSGGGTGGNPTMYVGPTGEATTNLAGTQVNMNPGSMVAPTAAANAAMATTQRVATGQPTTPRTPAQPKQQFVLPDAGTHYAQAEQGSANFGDTFNKAVSARASDLLKDAKQTGKPLTAQQANDLAFDEIKEWRRNNVDAFKPTNTPEPTAATAPEDISAPAPVKQEPVYNNPGEMRKALIGKMPTDEAEALIRAKFPPAAPAENTGSLFATSKAETPATKTITPEQQAKRDAFVNTTVKERVKEMEEGRAANKEIYAEQAETMRQMAAENKARGKKDDPSWGKGYYAQPNPKDVFTERKAVADMVYSVSKGNVTSKNKSIIVKRQGYNQMADDIGITLDWDTAPRAGQTIKETRKIMDKWMMDSINKELPELGLYKRRESYAQQQKRYQREAEAEEAAMTPEQREARDKQMAAMEKPLRTMDSNPTLKKLLNKGESPKTSSSLQAALDKAKANKGNPPPDAMKMATGPTTHANITDAAGDLMVKQMTNNNGMFETSYNKGKDIVFETKYPGYHSVVIEHPDGSKTVYKKHEIAGSTEYSRNTIDKGGVYSPFDTSRSKPEGWFSVEDEIGKGK